MSSGKGSPPSQVMHEQEIDNNVGSTTNYYEGGWGVGHFLQVQL